MLMSMFIYLGTTVIPANGEKVHSCLEFLSSIETRKGELTHLFNAKNVYDPVLQKRLKVGHVQFFVNLLFLQKKGGGWG